MLAWLDCDIPFIPSISHLCLKVDVGPWPSNRSAQTHVNIWKSKIGFGFASSILTSCSLNLNHFSWEFLLETQSAPLDACWRSRSVSARVWQLKLACMPTPKNESLFGCFSYRSDSYGKSSRQNPSSGMVSWLITVIFFSFFVVWMFFGVGSHYTLPLISNSVLPLVWKGRIFSQGWDWALSQYHRCLSPSGRRYHCCKTSLAPLPIPQLPAVQPALSRLGNHRSALCPRLPQCLCLF